MLYSHTKSKRKITSCIYFTSNKKETKLNSDFKWVKAKLYCCQMDDLDVKFWGKHKKQREPHFFPLFQPLPVPLFHAGGQLGFLLLPPSALEYVQHFSLPY